MFRATRRGLLGAIAVIGLTTASAQAQGQDGSRPVVEPARQVTADPAADRLYVSPDIAVDPENPETVVIGVGDARNGGCRLYVSRDVGLPSHPPLTPSCRPTCPTACS